MKLFEEYNTPFLLNIKGEGIKNAFMKKSYIDGFYLNRDDSGFERRA